MDRLDTQRGFAAVIGDLEDLELANDGRAQILQDKALVAVICPGVAQHAKRVTAAGNFREVLAVLTRRLLAHAANIAHHREAEGIGVEAAEAWIVEARLRSEERRVGKECRAR